MKTYILSGTMSEHDFKAAFLAVSQKAGEFKFQCMEEAWPHLEALNAIVTKMRDAGLSVRVELGMGEHVMPSNMRFVTDLRFRL